ncbi:protein GET4-like [Actinidia eriantha]|uniref:protein GET4-like n=1 Tax=Actinidia eriantha TaxID=165200 RepID=UPI00258DD1B8|nr:protein GET4-like [Actinidia eriantha]
MSRDRPRRGVLPPAQENVEKLAKVVKDGNCYGAQQMYKSVSARYISAERFSDALDILQSGACIQLEYEQVTCGAELAVLFVETLVKGKFPYDEDTLDRVRKIYKKFPRIPVPQHLDLAADDDMQKLHEALGAAKTRVDGCSSFLKAAIKWSAEFGAHRNGSPELHDMLAEYLYSETPEVEMNRVSYHFVRGKQPRKFASTLINFMGKCYPGEDDIAIARSVFMYLSLGNLRDANYLMDELKKQVKGKEVDFPQSDLIQFISYLLQTLQRDALPLFNMLRQTYKSSIDREPVFNELLDVIGEKFYGVQRRNPLQGIFGDMFKMMGSDGM